MEKHESVISRLRAQISEKHNKSVFFFCTGKSHIQKKSEALELASLTVLQCSLHLCVGFKKFTVINYGVLFRPLYVVDLRGVIELR